MSFNKLKTDTLVRLAKWIGRRSTAIQQRMGKWLGYLFYVFPNRRKKVAKTNLQLCFKDLSAIDRKHLLKANLVSTGQGIIEMLAALWQRDERIAPHFKIDGIEHIEKALSDNTGCLLLSCHTTSIEWGIRGLNQVLAENNLPIGHMLARQHNNKLFEAHLEEARKSFVDKLIDKKNIRSLLASIKSGHPVYYAPDQNFSYQVEFADFFGRPAATTVGTYKLAQKDVKIIPWFCFRTGPSQWTVEILPELSDLKELNERDASTRINQLFELQIKQYPEQYLWVHRRFKNQPEGFENPYV